ncbi:hypothetical protein [Burkholderia cenocepacia]|uniref:hypothetical protein n=1 Tax=Burkholderia cenocepacia TaxID=95486 RepID=UPI0013E0CF65|nr:hypothetical protein [Burkholderia cenocepacia]MCW3587357.1 hypothetical protein [Burkholderia cenocepacia]MCW3632561.1 hypothetical protein [Burkholderia cenocepacia]MCW5181792.1 hypothetical protein [Burkholderia cenocepacia]NGO98074.1 hypothetical protein [Burkholderia cenocepacia]
MTTEPNPQQSDDLHPLSGLVAAVEKLLGRALTKDEVIHWQRIQDTYGIADDDPLVLVLVLLGVHQHLFNDLPERIEKATERAIAIHRTTLEDQATIVTKGMLEKLTPMFVKAVSEAGRPAETTGHRVFPIASVKLAAIASVLWIASFFAAAFGAQFAHFISR